MREGQSERPSPWRTPNAPITDFSQEHDLGNGTRLTAFKWSPTDNFTYDWDQLSRLSDTLVNASPLLRHADHCNYCIESQSEHRQRSLSNEINRLKHELVEYWNGLYREVLDKAYFANHKRLVNSGVWQVVSRNVAGEDCKQVVLDNLEDVQEKWEKYSQDRFEKLVATVQDLLDPTEICDVWCPEPDEWSIMCAHKDASMIEWEKEAKTLMKAQLPQLEQALERQVIETSTRTQEAAMLARLDSFKQSMNIKIRVVQNEGDLIIPEGATLTTDQQSIFSGKTKRSVRTVKTIESVFSLRATEFKNKMRRFFGKSHKMEDADVTQMRKQIEELITLHAARVGQYKALLGCEAIVVETDVKIGVDEVWNYVIG
ncbi:hypothetical protein FRC11_014432 [Ceratobasidium sp. 423]|nr:hypothetical protein FRC11_014432 [Ceratobasidium sp. 423]